MEKCYEKQYCKLLCSKHYKQKYNSENKDHINKLARIRIGKNRPKSREFSRIDRIKHHEDRIQREKIYRAINQKILRDKHLKWTKEFRLKLGIPLKKVSLALMNWSLSVKDNDGSKCQVCGSTENIHAHHIFPKSKYPLLCLNINNGISLCHDCHWNLHRLN